MSGNVREMKTSAELGLAELFSAVKTSLPGAGEIPASREAAFARFAEKGLPHRRVEDWRYTDLRALQRDIKPLAQPPDTAAKKRAAAARGVFAGVDGMRLLLVDGVLVPELSDLSALEPGLSVRSMAEALAVASEDVAAHLGKVLPVSDPVVDLNTALMGDGVVIRIAAGARIGRPVHLVHINASAEASATFVRSLVIAGKGASATIVESHVVAGAPDYQVNAALELVVGDGAEIAHVKAVEDGAAALHVSTLAVSIGACATLNQFTFVTGGAVVRNQIFLRFDGERAVADLRGTNLLNGAQHVDTRLVVDHRRGSCTSRETFKSVLDGQSRAAFQGKIVVRPGAQKTDGKMMARALLLSEAAEADNKPELEIFADDVQCGHGATVGALDQDLRFYLMARGIPAKEAEALLIEAFVGEAIDGVAHEGLKDALMGRTKAWLKARG